MKARQRGLKVFFFEEALGEEFEPYIKRNFPLLNGFLLLFSHKLTTKQKELLNQHHLVFLEQENASFGNLKFRDDSPRPQQTIPQQPIPMQNTPTEETQPKNTTKTLTRTIRSGEEISNQGDIIIFGRVNSGAKIHCDGILQIFDCIDGSCECEGDFVIFRTIGNGEILFKGELIDKNLEVLRSFKHNSLKKVRMDDGVLHFEEII